MPCNQPAGPGGARRQDESRILRDRGGNMAVFVDPIEKMGIYLGSFSDGARASGADASSVWINKTLATATEGECLKLGIASGSSVARLSRVRLWDGEPLATEHTVLPEWAVASLDRFDSSIYAELQRLGHRPVRAKQVIRASLATSVEAAMLHVGEFAEVLRIERIAMIADGRVVELTRSIYRGDRFQFVDALRGSLVSAARPGAHQMPQDET